MSDGLEVVVGLSGLYKSIFNPRSSREGNQGMTKKEGMSGSDT